MQPTSLHRTVSEAVSRSGKFLLEEGALGSSWCLRVAAFGAFLGAVVGALGQAAILAAGSPAMAQSLEPSLWHRLVGVSVTSLAYGAVGLVLGLVSAAWVRHPLGRWLAVGWVTSAFSLLFAANLVSTVVRILSGTHVTVGVLAFLMSSPEHLAHGALGGHAWSVRGVVVTVLLFAALTAMRTRGLLRAPGAPRLRVVTFALAVLLVSLGTAAGSAQAMLDPRVFASTAELAFARSVQRPSALLDVALSVDGDHAPRPDPGPARVVEGLWEQALDGGARPNVLIVMLESVPHRHLGYEGYRRGVTPNLDELAKNGLRVRRTWATATHSNYAQMAVLSSLLPRRRHHLDMYQDLDYPRFLQHDLLTRLGYVTATVSSQDETWQGMRRFQDTGTPTHYWHALDHAGPHLDIGSERVVPDEITVAQVKDWLEHHQDAPWGLYVNLQATHFPYKLLGHVPRRFRPDDPNPRTFSYLGYPASEREVVLNRYDNALAYVDAQIGRLRNHLLSTGQYEDTLWVITSDHGEMFHEHGMVTHGKTLYENETRVPLIFHWPKRIQPGDRWEQASHLDVMPTVSELLGVPSHPSYQGRSLLGPVAKERSAVFMTIQGIRSMDGVVCYPWKLVYDCTGGEAYLFHLGRDPGEKVNLVAKEARVAGAMASLLQMQIDAQVGYHEKKERMDAEFQPRLGKCPGWL